MHMRSLFNLLRQGFGHSLDCLQSIIAHRHFVVRSHAWCENKFGDVVSYGSFMLERIVLLSCFLLVEGVPYRISIIERYRYSRSFMLTNHTGPLCHRVKVS